MKWSQQIQTAYTDATAHAFILHFNVRDYVAPGTSLNEYLAHFLARKELIVYYSLRGFSFPSASMEKRFREAAMSGAAASPVTLAAMRAVQQETAELPADPGAALPLIDRVLRQQQNVVVIVNDADLIWPEADTAAISPRERTNLATALYWGMDRAIGDAGNMVVFTTTSLINLHSQLRATSSRYMAVEIPLPDEATRLEFIRRLWENAPAYTSQLDAAEFARLTAGLCLIHIEDIHFEAMRDGNLSQTKLAEVKRRILNSEYAEVIELVEPEFGFEAVGGLDYLVAYFRQNVIIPFKEGRLYRVPKGILMIGPPGTGKSLIAKAVAKEAGINVVFFNLARILGQYVGNSERNLERAMRAIISLEPTIVFIDEVDQTVSRSTTGTTGVDTRIFKRLLEVMGDESLRGKVIFLMASNRPDLMDDAFKRDGRVDAKILVPPPDTAEKRIETLRVLARLYDLALVTFPKPVLEATEGWTGANLAALVRKAKQIMEDEGVPAGKALQAALSRLIVNTARNAAYIGLALREINDLDYVPEAYREQARRLAQTVADEAEEATRPEARRGQRPW